MYADRSHLRKHEIKVRVNEDQLAVVDSMARLNRRQRAVFALELIFEALEAREKRMGDTRAIGSR